MQQFQELLKQTGEIGFVRRLLGGVAYVEGLPTVRPGELVWMETEQRGQVLSMQANTVEVLLLDKEPPRLGTRVVRAGTLVTLGVGELMLGRVIDPLGVVKDGRLEGYQAEEFRKLDIEAPGVMDRKDIDKPFETGVAAVDLGVPLGMGQRELVIGDRKTGKRSFLRQAIMMHIQRGGVVVYAVIGQRTAAALELQQFLEQFNLKQSAVIVLTTSADAPGLIYQTPYSAMTVAEFFRDKGREVLLLLDDLTVHAHCYRELSLLAGRFPGRDAYPGDVFYLHSRLLERAGNYEAASITCLPVVSTVLGDISGYIQTNLMSMTDGHIFFDHELYNQGRRPAVNQFLSVTRVGRQTQTSLLKSLSRELSSFLVRLEKLRQLQHFGGEVSEEVKTALVMGQQVEAFFNQPVDQVVPLNLNAMFLAGLWNGFWKETGIEVMKRRLQQLSQQYVADADLRQRIKLLLDQCQNFSELVVKIDAWRDWMVGDGAVAKVPPVEKEIEKQDIVSTKAVTSKVDEQKPSSQPEITNHQQQTIPTEIKAKSEVAKLVLPESMVPKEEVGV